MDKVTRIRSWQDFKRLTIQLKPESVVYNIEQNGLSPKRDLACLRLIMPTRDAYCILISREKGSFRETRIPIQKDKNGNKFLTDNDVKSFLKTQLGRRI